MMLMMIMAMAFGIFTTLAYSEPDIFRALLYLESWHIQNLDMFRTLAYWEPWLITFFGKYVYNRTSCAQVHDIYMLRWTIVLFSRKKVVLFQKPGIFRTSSTFTALSNICDGAFYENNANFFLHYFESSIVKWGYQDNFKAVYFLTKRFRAHKNM